MYYSYYYYVYSYYNHNIIYQQLLRDGFGAFRTVTVIDLIRMMFQKNLDCCFLTLKVTPERNSTDKNTTTRTISMLRCCTLYRLVVAIKRY